MSLELGVVADDVTGAVDLAGAVSAAGWHTVVLLGVPRDTDDVTASCAVVALTTRTADASVAVEQSLAAGRWLLARGSRRLYQKYCSTFDSTDAGNIGPVADALAGLVAGRGARPRPVAGTPATPSVARTQYLGHLFVSGRLLSESSLRDHPLTPMRDPDLVRVLGRQTAGAVGLVPWPEVRGGADAVTRSIARLESDGVAHVLLDAVTEEDLGTLARAVVADGGRRLLGGAAGLATALARLLAPGTTATAQQSPRVERGRALVVSGSCSERTREQVGRHPGPLLGVGVDDLVPSAESAVARIVQSLERVWRTDPDAVPLVSSTADPAQVRAAQEAVGRERAAALVEHALGAITEQAVTRLGARRLVVAGGETSGAVTTALGVRTLHVGALVEPGLAWTVSGEDPHLALLLKSGNFGSPDLFTTAWEGAP